MTAYQWAMLAPVVIFGSAIALGVVLFHVIDWWSTR